VAVAGTTLVTRTGFFGKDVTEKTKVYVTVERSRRASGALLQLHKE